MAWILPWKRSSTPRSTDPIVPTRIIVTPHSLRRAPRAVAMPMTLPSSEPLFETSAPTLPPRESAAAATFERNPVRTSLGLVPLDDGEELMNEEDFCPATGKTVVLSLYAFDARAPLDETDDEIWLDIADPDTRDR